VRSGVVLPFDQTPNGLGSPQLSALGDYNDDFALYTALRNKKAAELGTAQNYVVSWPYNPAVIDSASVVGLTDQRLVMVPQIVRAGAILDGVAWIQQTVGNYTANNTNGIACYSFDGANFTRLAQGIAAQTWGTGASTGYNIQAFNVAVPAIAADRILWACALWCRSAVVQAPILGASLSATGGGIGACSPGLGTYSFEVDVAGSTNFPATIAAASVTAGDTNRHWLAFYHNSV
jgi:hypothetical protein